jgi:hypothetical protein
MRKLEPVENSIWKALTRLGIAEPMRERYVLAKWDQLVGPHIAKSARPMRFEEGMLWVAVKSHSWAQELQMQSVAILKKLNKEAGKKMFTGLRFVVRTRLPAAPVIVEESVASEPILEIKLTPGELDSLTQSLQKVEDDRLRDALQAAMEAWQCSDKRHKVQGWRPCERCGCFHNDPEPFCFLCREQS